MRLHLVKKLVACLDKPHLTSFHYHMFHGMAERPGVVHPQMPRVSIQNRIRVPLELTRSGRLVPDVFMPNTSLVVCEELMRKLAHLPNLEFLPVKMKKLIGYPPYPPGDFSFYEDPICDYPEQLWERMPDVPEYHRQIGNYYELITAATWEVVNEYPAAGDVTVFVGPSEYDELFEERVSGKMFEDYPILAAYFHIALGHEAFSILSPHVDWEHFVHAETELR